MTDNNQQNPPPGSPVVNSAIIPTVSIESLETKAKKTIFATVKDLWGKYSLFFTTVGLLLLAAKFSNVLMDLLNSASKKDLQNAQKTDIVLKAKEETANQQADALVKQAEDLPKQEGTVQDDWFKKDK